MLRRSLTLGITTTVLALVGACTAGTSDDGVFSSGSQGTGGGSEGGASSTGTEATTTTSSGFEVGVGGSSGVPGCDSGPDEDKDEDGYTVTQGDCNDCDPNVNPGAVEVPTPTEGEGGGDAAPEPADENCDGQIDEAPTACDDALAIDSMDPNDAARAVGLVGLIGIGSLAGRLAIGALADRIGRPLTLTLMQASLGASLVLWSGSGGYVSFAAFALWMGLSYGGIVSLMPALVMDFFGARAVSSIIGVLYTGAALGNLGGPWLAGAVFDRSGSYQAVIWGCVVLSALATLAAWRAVAPTPAARS